MTSKTVFVFTLDAKGIRICETSNEVANKKKRKEVFNTKFKSCTTPDFFTQGILPVINASKPSMLFFVTSSESTVQSYFHTDFLKNILVENGYSLLKGSSVNKSDLTSTNISLYVKSEEEQNYMDGQKFRYRIDYDTFDFRKYGAIGIKFVTIEGNKKTSYCFVGVSLPNDGENPVVSRAKKTIYLNDINRKIIQDSKKNKPDYLIVAGDFGYLLDQENDISRLDLSGLLELDYINNEKKNRSSVFFNMKEGVSDEGPSFFPTFESRIGRNVERCNEETSNFENYRKMCLSGNTELVGWSSRILYSSNYFDISCEKYLAVDYGNSKNFNNIGVMSIINVTY